MKKRFSIPPTVRAVTGAQAHILFACMLPPLTEHSRPGEPYAIQYDSTWYRGQKTRDKARAALQESGLIGVDSPHGDFRAMRITLARPLTPVELEHVREKYIAWKWEHKRCPYCGRGVWFNKPDCRCPLAPLPAPLAMDVPGDPADPFRHLRFAYGSDRIEQVRTELGAEATTDQVFAHMLSQASVRVGMVSVTDDETGEKRSAACAIPMTEDAPETPEGQIRSALLTSKSN